MRWTFLVAVLAGCVGIEQESLTGATCPAGGGSAYLPASAETEAQTLVASWAILDFYGDPAAGLIIIGVAREPPGGGPEQAAARMRGSVSLSPWSSLDGGLRIGLSIPRPDGTVLDDALEIGAGGAVADPASAEATSGAAVLVERALADLAPAPSIEVCEALADLVERDRCLAWASAVRCGSALAGALAEEGADLTDEIASCREILLTGGRSCGAEEAL